MNTNAPFYNPLMGFQNNEQINRLENKINRLEKDIRILENRLNKIENRDIKTIVQDEPSDMYMI